MAGAQEVHSTRGDSASSRFDASAVLSAYFLLTIIVPSQSIIAPLGTVGAPSTIVAMGVLGWWVWHHVHRIRRSQGLPQWVRRTALLFVIVMLVVYRHAAMQPLVADEIQPADSGLMRVLALMGVVLTASDGISSTERWHDLLDRMVSVTVAVSVLALFQFITGQLWIDRFVIPGLANSGTAQTLLGRGAFMRPSGTASHPIEFSAVLGMMLPLVVNRARFVTKGRLRAWAGVGVVLLVVFVSVSRTALICTALAFLILVPSWPRTTRRLALLGGTIVLVGAAVAVPGLLGTLRGLFQGSADDPSVLSRTAGYAYAAEMFGQNPWFGKGYGTFLPRYYIFDNGYLQLSMETGLAGVGCFLGLLVAAIMSAHRAARLFTLSRDKEMARALVAAVTAGGVSVAFFDLFAFPQSAGCLVLAVGLSGAALRLAREDPAAHLRRVTNQRVVASRSHVPSA